MFLFLDTYIPDGDYNAVLQENFCQKKRNYSKIPEKRTFYPKITEKRTLERFLATLTMSYVNQRLHLPIPFLPNKLKKKVNLLPKNSSSLNF